VYLRVLELNKGGKVARIKVDSSFDLWHLEKIISKGDFVTARTQRNIFIQREEGKEKVRKKFVVLKIGVEKIEFDEKKNKLRLNGRIVEAPEEISKGDYHTIEVGVGLVLKIEKQEWSVEQLKRLEKAKTRLEFLKDSRLLNELFVHLNKQDGLATYGFEQVKTAAEYGAVRIAFVDEEKIREKEFEELVEKIVEKRGEIKLISRKNPEGKSFCVNYSIATILRFVIS
jgi:stalled ribosome rescue protein Dom34